jgi:hypothetical protein
MNVKCYKFITCGVLALLLLSVACGSGGGSGKRSTNAVISDGVMTTAVDNDSRPTGKIATSFPSDTPVLYCSFKVVGVVPEDMIKASWYYVKGEAGGRENELLNETFTIAESDASEYFLAFYLDKPVQGWYKGDYKVVISVNSIEKLSVPFKIE